MSELEPVQKLIVNSMNSVLQRDYSLASSSLIETTDITSGAFSLLDPNSQWQLAGRLVLGILEGEFSYLEREMRQNIGLLIDTDQKTDTALRMNICLAYARAALSRMQLLAGESNFARRALEESKAILCELKDPLSEARLHQSKAMEYLFAKELDRAKQRFEKAIVMVQFSKPLTVRERRYHVELLVDLAQVLRERKAWSECKEVLKEARLLEECGECDHIRMGKIFANLGEIEYASSGLLESRAAFETALEHYSVYPSRHILERLHILWKLHFIFQTTGRPLELQQVRRQIMEVKSLEKPR